MLDWRAVAALYAGLFFNLTALEVAGYDRGMAEAPLSLAIWIGRPAALFIKWVLLPVWLVTWLGGNIDIARHAVTGLPMFLAWLVVASIGVTNPVRGALFGIKFKVSVALTLGLLLSVRDYLSFNYLDLIAWCGPPQSLSAHLLPWALPPLLLAGSFRTAHPKRVALFGIILPLLIAAFAAIYTMNGAGHLSVYFLAARFAAHFTLRLTGLDRNTTNAILVTIALAATLQFIPAWWGEHPLWLLASVPFAPLAGVLAARRAPPAWALAAWLIGCVAGYTTGLNMVVGWLVSFVTCSAAQLPARLAYGRPTP